MNKDEILELLENVKDGKIAPSDALFQMQIAPFKDLDYAKLDFHRQIRQGSQEVIFAQNKTKEQIFGIVSSMAEAGLKNILATRINKENADFLKKNFVLNYSETANLAVICPAPIEKIGNIVIASGGTSDMPICEEAAITAETLGNNVVRLYDVGVAGIHRLLSKYEVLLKANVIIAVAGMEGALPSVIGGLASCPVIAVPTSICYGAGFKGLSALLSMLNSCANSVSTVNIDNGFGAGYIASGINRPLALALGNANNGNRNKL
ncbi:MAG: nickel pincer cofactor biosynthesis protein LarB [Elusimicrobiota bacterium]|jgi:NCAIR mutase (PurE)-related protein|nr:nickel pincer cofactor biosynthesis protein LarB [Elusimicrobiota bacterium]